MIDGTHVETVSPQFVRHLAGRLVTARRSTRRPLWLLARRSRGRFSARDLRDAESGALTLDAETVSDLAALYGLDLGSVLPDTRGGLEIRPSGLISAGGVTMSFEPGDPASLVDAYFRLTRALRSADDETTIPLRRDDVQAIAHFLQHTGSPSRYLESVLAVSIAERRVLVGSLVAGAASIGLAGLTEQSSPSVVIPDRT